MGNVISSVYDLRYAFQFSFWLAPNIRPILQLLPGKELVHEANTPIFVAAIQGTGPQTN